MVISIVTPMTNNLAFGVTSNETEHDLDLKNLTNDPSSQIAVLDPHNETAHDPTSLNFTNGILPPTGELSYDILSIDLIRLVLLFVVLLVPIGITVYTVIVLIRDLRKLKKLHPILHDMPILLYIALILLSIILPSSIIFMIIKSKSIDDILPIIVALLTTIVLSMLNIWISKRYATTSFQEMYKKLDYTAATLTNLKQKTVANKHNLNRLNSIDSALKNVDSTLNDIHDILDKVNKKLDKQDRS